MSILVKNEKVLYKTNDTEHKSSYTPYEMAKSTFKYIQKDVIPLLYQDLKNIANKNVREYIELKLDITEKAIRTIQFGKCEIEGMIHIVGITEYDDAILNRNIDIINSLLHDNQDKINSSGEQDLFTVLGNILNTIKNDEKKLNLYWSHIEKIYENCLQFQLSQENTEE